MCYRDVVLLLHTGPACQSVVTNVTCMLKVLQGHCCVVTDGRDVHIKNVPTCDVLLLQR